VGLALTPVFEPHPSHPLHSAYNHSTATSREEQYHDTEALAPVGRAVWQLVLAMLAKTILTIFTFGMKVSLVFENKVIF